MCFNIDGLLRSNTTRLGRIRDQEEEAFVSLVSQKSTENAHWGHRLTQKNIADIIANADILSLKISMSNRFEKKTDINLSLLYHVLLSILCLFTLQKLGRMSL